MRCNKLKDVVLTDYIDGRLEGKLYKDVENHIETCADCRRLIGQLASIRVLLGKLKNEAPPPVYVESASGFRRERFRHLRPALALAAAAAVIIVILAALRIMPYGMVSVPETDQYDVLSSSYLTAGVNESDYDFGTTAEEYFL